MRLVVADVDGTLVTPHKILTPRAREAVREVMKADIAFAITRGVCDGELPAHRTVSYKYVPPERVGIFRKGYISRFPRLGSSMMALHGHQTDAGFDSTEDLL